MLNSSMRIFDRADIDDIQPKVVAAILDVNVVANELARCRDEAARGSRAQRKVSDVQVRLPSAVVDNIHRKHPAREVLTERREALTRWEHFGRDTQKSR